MASTPAPNIRIGTVDFDNEVLIRTHEENAELRSPLLATRLLVDTGRRVKSGFVDLELWNLTGVRE